jgi:alcohol dehydrogenase class IV
MMQMVLQASANEAQQNIQDVDPALEVAIQESMNDNPNPDQMTYEQLQELGDKIGVVSKGYSDYDLSKIRAEACFDSEIEDCPICLTGIELASLIKELH